MGNNSSKLIPGEDDENKTLCTHVEDKPYHSDKASLKADTDKGALKSDDDQGAMKSGDHVLKADEKAGTGEDNQVGQKWAKLSQNKILKEATKENLRSNNTKADKYAKSKKINTEISKGKKKIGSKISVPRKMMTMHKAADTNKKQKQTKSGKFWSEAFSAKQQQKNAADLNKNQGQIQAAKFWSKAFSAKQQQEKAANARKK